MQPKPPESPWDDHIHWLPSKANDFVAFFDLVVNSVWSGVRLAEVCRVFWQMCAWKADGWKPDTWGINSPGTPGSPEGSQLRWELWALGWHCWLREGLPLLTITIAECSVLFTVRGRLCSWTGDGMAENLLLRRLQHKLVTLDQNKCSHKYTCSEFHSRVQSSDLRYYWQENQTMPTRFKDLCACVYRW